MGKQALGAQHERLNPQHNTSWEKGRVSLRAPTLAKAGGADPDSSQCDLGRGVGAGSFGADVTKRLPCASL